MSEEPIVLVDARNVMRSRWPNIEEERFLELLHRWAVEQGTRAFAVFDGQAPGGRLGEHEVDEQVVVVGTGAGSADDWIAEHALAAHETSRLWLVSSDRALRERVAGLLERSTGGGAFAGQLEVLAPPDRAREHR